MTPAVRRRLSPGMASRTRCGRAGGSTAGVAGPSATAAPGRPCRCSWPARATSVRSPPAAPTPAPCSPAAASTAGATTAMANSATASSRALRSSRHTHRGLPRPSRARRSQRSSTDRADVLPASSDAPTRHRIRLCGEIIDTSPSTPTVSHGRYFRFEMAGRAGRAARAFLRRSTRRTGQLHHQRGSHANRDTSSFPESERTPQLAPEPVRAADASACR